MSGHWVPGIKRLISYQFFCLTPFLGETYNIRVGLTSLSDLFNQFINGPKDFSQLYQFQVLHIPICFAELWCAYLFRNGENVFVKKTPTQSIQSQTKVKPECRQPLLMTETANFILSMFMYFLLSSVIRRKAKRQGKKVDLAQYFCTEGSKHIFHFIRKASFANKKVSQCIAVRQCE